MYNSLGRSHRMFMEALHSLASSTDTDRDTLSIATRYDTLSTATRYGYSLYGPRGLEVGGRLGSASRRRILS